MERRQQVGLLCRFHAYAEITKNELEHLRGIEMGMKNIRARVLPVFQPLQEMPHQSGLAGAGFARKHQQTPMRFDSEHHFRKRVFIRRARKQESRIWRNVKRIFPKSKGSKELVIDGSCTSCSHRTPVGGLGDKIVCDGEVRSNQKAGQAEDWYYRNECTRDEWYSPFTLKNSPSARASGVAGERRCIFCRNR